MHIVNKMFSNFPMFMLLFTTYFMLSQTLSLDFGK